MPGLASRKVPALSEAAKRRRLIETLERDIKKPPVACPEVSNPRAEDSVSLCLKRNALCLKSTQKIAQKLAD
jgi:hypothetical protein